MAVRGIRGATTAEADTEAAILEATRELLTAVREANQVQPEDVAGIWFTTSRDLSAEFPARAARRLGWTEVPMLCGHEMEVPARNTRSVPRCIRVLLLVNTERPASEVRFVYLRGATHLRSEP
jgi:chorismate mutase